MSGINKLICGASTTNQMIETVNACVDGSKALDGIKALEAIEGVTLNVTGFYAGSSVGGGQFIYDATRGKADHNGGTVIAPEAIAAWDGTSGDITTLLDWSGAGIGCFVRLMNNESSISSSIFGAKADNGITPNNVVFRKALLAAANSGFGSVDVDGIDGKWYGLEQINGTSAILQQSNVDFVGVGWPTLKPIIDTTEFMEASIFITGNYHPDFFQGVPKESVTLETGESIINVGNSSDYDIGSLIFITSQSSSITAGFPIYTYMELAEVIGHSSATSIEVDTYVDFEGAGFVAKANDNGVNGRFGIPLHILSNSKIKGFNVDTLGYINPDSGTRNCEISNIIGKARSGVYGNTFTHTKFDNWNLTCDASFSELSFGSHNNTLTNMKFRDDADGLSSNNGISWQESGRFNVIDGFELQFNGSSRTASPIRILDQQNSKAVNGNIKIKSNGNNVLSLSASSTANRLQPKNNGFDNITIESVYGVPVVVDILQAGSTGKLTNCFATNITYIGQKPSLAVLRMQGNASNTIEGAKISIRSDGDSLPVSLSNSRGNNLVFMGDFNYNHIKEIISQGNYVDLFSLNRSKLLSVVGVEPLDISVNTTTANNIVKEYEFDAGSISNTDLVNFEAYFTTSGISGLKNVEFGVINSEGGFSSLGLSFVGQLNCSIKCSIKLRNTDLTSGTLSIENWVKDGANTSTFNSDRIGFAVPTLASNKLTLQLRAWVQTSGDGINFNLVSLDVNS